MTIQSCNPIVRLQPTIDLDQFFNESNSAALARINLKVSFKQQATEKGCSRSTYDIVKQYEVCKTEKIIQLLPSFIASNETYVHHVKHKVLPKGGLDYVFDGGTAVRYPTKQLTHDWFKKYTITGWILTQFHDSRQYIISWSDGDTLRHDNTGFYTTRRPGSSHLVFGFHHMHEVNGVTCMLKKKWRVIEDRVDWKFITLTFQQCTVELLINGSKVEPLGTPSHYHLPEKHIQPKFVIGARWAGSMLKYDNYFKGKISALVLTPNFIFNRKVTRCLLECNERLEYSRGTRDLDEEINQNGNQLSLQGDINKSDFIQTLSDIIYYNSDDMGVTSQHKIHFHVKDLFTTVQDSDEINVKMLKTKPNVTLSGNCNGIRDNVLFFKQGIRLCTKLKINIKGCVQTLDALHLSISPKPTKSEKIYIASPFLRRHHLTLKATETGFVVYGIASVSQYTEILYHIKYSFNGILRDDLQRTVSMVLSSKNGLIKSRVYKLNVRANKDSVMVVPDNFHLPTKSRNSPAHVNNAFQVIRSMSHDTFLPFTKKLATKTNKSSQHGSTVWLVLACTFSFVIVVSLVGYGAVQWKSRHSILHQPLEEDEEIVTANHNAPTEYFWDEEGLPMTLTINPSERVSITNDPYADILLHKDLFIERGSVTEGSNYSDDEEDTEFDTDSIRQLEWDCLENSIDTILLQEDDETISNISSNDHAKTTIL